MEFVKDFAKNPEGWRVYLDAEQNSIVQKSLETVSAMAPSTNKLELEARIILRRYPHLASLKPQTELESPKFVGFEPEDFEDLEYEISEEVDDFENLAESEENSDDLETNDGIRRIINRIRQKRIKMQGESSDSSMDKLTKSDISDGSNIDCYPE